MKKWYEEYFENFGKGYEKEEYTKGTKGECDFFEQEINFNKNFRILDIGCGTGRHAIELARRGYNVTGIDLSESMLQQAKKKAEKEKLKVEFQQADARDLKFKQVFDLVIMMCEGAFPLMETDEMNFQILGGAARALNTGGRFIFTTLNGLYPLFHSVKDFINAADPGSKARYRDNHFDLLTFREHNISVVEDDLGYKKELKCNERYYVPSEITWLLKSLGFYKIDIFGAKLGSFSRHDKLTTEDFEMLVVAEKK